MAGSFVRGVALVLGLMAMGAAHAAGRASSTAAQGGDVWVSFGAGYYNGQDYNPPQGQPAGPAQEAEGHELMAAITIAESLLLGRLRVSWLADYTRNTAEEVAGLVGLPLSGHKVFLAAGVSRLTDVAADRQSPIVGVPVELLFYPTRGLELSIHGNFNSQSDFVGVTLAGVFGKRRAR